jgi:hypothetical protein
MWRHDKSVWQDEPDRLSDLAGVSHCGPSAGTKLLNIFGGRSDQRISGINDVSVARQVGQRAETMRALFERSLLGVLGRVNCNLCPELFGKVMGLFVRPNAVAVVKAICASEKVAKRRFLLRSHASLSASESIFHARRFYILPALLAITACSHTPVAVCPAPVPYDAATQAAAADELCQLVGLQANCTAEEMAARPQSTLDRFMTDYGVLRAKLRACQ